MRDERTASRSEGLSNDKMRSLEEISGSENRFRKLVEALPDGIVVHVNGKIVFVSPFTVNLHNATTPEQLSDMTSRNSSSPSAFMQQSVESRTATGPELRRPPLEAVLIGCVGSEVDVEAVAIPTNWNGATAIEVVLRNIRKRKKAENAVVVWQERVEWAQESGLRIGLSDLDLATTP